MPDDAADDFLSAALAAVDGKDDNAEIRQLLTGELTRAAQEASPETLHKATALLQAEKPARRARPLGRLAALVVVLTALSCMAFNAWPFYVYREALSWMGFMWSGNLSGMVDLRPGKEIPGLPDATAHQRLVLHGSPGHENMPDRYLALAESEPGKATYYEAYIRGLSVGRGALPPDFEDKVRAIDPDNGILFLRAADLSGKNAVKRSKATQTYQVIDSKAFGKSLYYFHLAAADPTLHSHLPDLIRERRDIFPVRGDYLSTLSNDWVLSTTDFSLTSVLSLRDVLCAAAKLCGEDQDKDSFLQISQEWRSVCEKLLEYPPVALIDLVMFRSTLMEVSPIFRQAAADLGLEEERRYYEKMTAGLDRLKLDIRDSSMQAKAGYSYASGESLESSTAGLLTPPSKPGELKPDRLATHAFFQRITLFAASGVSLLLAGAAAAYRFRSSALSRKLAAVIHRMSSKRVLPMAIAASLAPLLLGAVQIWGPGGATRWNVFWGGLFLADLWAMTAVTLALLLPLQLVRLNLRREALAAVSPPPGAFTIWSGWIACGCATAAWIVAAFIPGRSGFEDLFNHHLLMLTGVDKPVVTDVCAVFFWTACGLLAVPVVWLIFTALRALFSSRRLLPRRLATARLVLPAWLAAVLFLAILQPLLHALEKSYIARNPLEQRSVRYPHLSMVRERIFETTRQRLIQIVEEAKSAS